MEIKRKETDLIVSVSPHIRSPETVSRIMWTVVISLLPAFLAGIYYFGLRAVYVVAFCIIGSLLSEWFMEKMSGKEITLGDGSALLSGLLLGLTMPVTVPFYIPLISSFMAVGITKHIFGGLGYNIFNPALVGRAFALITWPRAMTTWVEPVGAQVQNGTTALGLSLEGFTKFFSNVDIKSSATPLGILKLDGIDKLLEKFGDRLDLYFSLLIGNCSGSLGETSIIALLIGGLFLLYKGYISWHIPVSYIVTVGVLAWIMGGSDGIFTGDPVIHILSGGLMMGAFFMATDYVTSPSVKNGKLLFGAGCGLLTVLIRLKAGYPEGVMFAILIMNCFTPLIDRNFRANVFGLKKGK